MALYNTPERALARIDIGAIADNVKWLKGLVGDQVAFCAVVKADGYGHGDVWSAKASLAGGATWLAVVSADEVEELRLSSIDTPILVMGALTRRDLEVVLAANADITVWDPDFLDQVATHADQFGRRARIHIKYDSGMGRLGTTDPALVLELCERVAQSESLELTGLMTHFATADQLDDSYFGQQLDRFNKVVETVRQRWPNCCVHAANSAATIRSNNAHFDMVRCGIAIYGLDPFQGEPTENGLRPALALESYVAAIKPIKSGQSVGYGRSWTAKEDTNIAVLPIGYGDGVRRGLSNRGDVLIGGSRYPFIGTVSMDNVTVELGCDHTVSVGDRVTLVGCDGAEKLRAEEVARSLGTINYELTCGLTKRVRRFYVENG